MTRGQQRLALLLVAVVLGLLVGRGVGSCEWQDCGVAHAAEPSSLARAIVAYPSTGRPSIAEAEVMVGAFEACAATLGHDDIDAPLLAAVASFESGFRPDAVPVTGPRMLGLMQLNPRYLPRGFPWRDVRANVGEACAKLARVLPHHNRNGRGRHSLIVHHFSGFRVTAAALANARDVARRRLGLLRLMGSRSAS